MTIGGIVCIPCSLSFKILNSKCENFSFAFIAFTLFPFYFILFYFTLPIYHPCFHPTTKQHSIAVFYSHTIHSNSWSNSISFSNWNVLRRKEKSGFRRFRVSTLRDCDGRQRRIKICFKRKWKAF